MAYYLLRQPDQLVAFPSLSWTSNVWSIEFDVKFESTFTTGEMLITSASGDVKTQVTFQNGGDTLRLRAVGTALTNYDFSITSVDRHTRHIYKIESNGSDLLLFIDGDLFATKSGDAIQPPEALVGLFSTFRDRPDTDLEFYGISFSGGFASQRNYDPSASGGTGSILPDTIGGNDGTLVDFPVDNSQWVFYGATGGVTGDAAFNLPILTLSASGSATVPQPTAIGAFTLNLLTVSASGTATLPQPDISGAFSLQPVTVSSTGSATLPQPNITGAFSAPPVTLSGAASATLPHPDIIGAFSYPLLSVSASGSATTANPFISGNITFEKLTISGAASATLPQPDISGAFSVPKLTVSGTASALVPQPIINGNIALEKLTISAIGAATLPQPIAIGAFNIPIATVSGFATISGLTLIIDSKTNINQQFLNANISQKNLSNNIIYY